MIPGGSVYTPDGPLVTIGWTLRAGH